MFEFLHRVVSSRWPLRRTGLGIVVRSQYAVLCSNRRLVARRIVEQLIPVRPRKRFDVGATSYGDISPATDAGRVITITAAAAERFIKSTQPEAKVGDELVQLNER